MGSLFSRTGHQPTIQLWPSDNNDDGADQGPEGDDLQLARNHSGQVSVGLQQSCTQASQLGKHGKIQVYMQIEKVKVKTQFKYMGEGWGISIDL